MDAVVGETVTVIRPSGAVPFGETRPTGSVEHDILGCLFAPLGSSEAATVGQDVTVAQPAVYAPPGADVVATDRVRVRGVVYEVDGVPGRWVSPFTGAEIGVVVALRNVEG